MVLIEDLEENAAICGDLVDAHGARIGELNTKAAMRQGNILYMLSCITVPMAPIQLMTGIYGMNFESMPELHAPHGYAVWWLVSLTLTSLTVFLFSRYGLFRNVRLEPVAP
jgi:Mg2+ and Co2+ transporter CorA